MRALESRLRHCAKLAGSGNELARLANIPRRTLEAYLKGASEPKASILVAIADIAGVSLDWLLAGRGQPHARATSPEQEDSVFIPVYHPCIGAGPGDWEDRARIVARLAFPPSALARRQLSADRLVALNIEEDANIPTLNGDDVVLVDRSCNRFERDGLYVIQAEGYLHARRLQRQFDGHVSLFGDNRTYPAIRVPQENLHNIEIIGRIVWAGSWLY